MQSLPIVKIPEPLNDVDKTALRIVSQASVIPVTKRLFPNYRQRQLEEDQEPISAWSEKDYQEITGLSARSNELKQLTLSQIAAMSSLLGGVNIDGMLSGLLQKQEGIPENTGQIIIDRDNIDSFRNAAPKSWQSELSALKSITGGQCAILEVSQLFHSHGEKETKDVLKAFSLLEQEKGRPHEIWVFGLNCDGWDDKLVALKKELRTCGYEAFALEFEPKRAFFASKDEADRYATKLNAGTSPIVSGEGPAELIIDKEANVISTTGKVERRELEPERKRHVEQLESQTKLLTQALSFFGANSQLGNIINRKIVGLRFQFAGYPCNWIPAHAKIEPIANDKIKISVPERFAVSTKCREAFVIRNYDQYKYLVAQGVTAINYGMSGVDVIKQLKEWDQRFGLLVLHARYDSVIAKLDRIPADLPDFIKQARQLCPEGDQNQTEAEYARQLKENKEVAFWWD